jgi:transposase
MRGIDQTKQSLFSYRKLEERVPDDRLLLRFKVLGDAVLRSMNDDFEAMYAAVGRPSIAPERLLRASLLTKGALYHLIGAPALRTD